MNDVALVYQNLGQIGPVLTGYTSYNGSLIVLRHLSSFSRI